MTKTTSEIVAALQDLLENSRAKIARLQLDIAAEEQRAKDAETTLKTLRIMGVDSGIVKPETGSPKAVVGKPKPRVPEMILTVLKLPEFRNSGGEPSRVLQVIQERIDPDADPNNVRPTLWRMQQKGILDKSEGRYRIRDLADGGGPNLFDGEGPPAADSKPQAQGRKAGPGGGT